MPYQKHNRYISNEQFSDGTTIDGSRIDNALQDVQNLVNAVPKGDLENRYTQTQFVMGWSPANTWRQNEADTGLPWLNAVNSDLDLATVTGGTPGPPESYQNPQRAKGYVVRGVSPALPESFIEDYSGKQYIWTTPIHFNKRVFIQSLKLLLLTDSNSGSGLYPYQNNFLISYGGAGAIPSKDLSVQIIVDRPVGYGSEDRRLSQVLANKTGFEIAYSKVNQTVAAPTADMFPDPYPGGNLKGAYCDVTINEPIPSGSRIRVCVIIPDYGSQIPAIVSGWDSGSGADKPWLSQYYSSTLTVLEELER